MVANPPRLVALTLALATAAIAVVIAIIFTGDGRASSSVATRQLIGHSVRGRAIYAYERGDPNGPTVLVVGSIHGNEPAGIAVAKRLLKLEPPEGTDLWVIPDLNPDGHAAHTRQNAHGVDLNRNFPWRWRRLKGNFYSGRRRLSEPESRAAYRLISRLQPLITIWFHQSLGAVDSSQGSRAQERIFARVAGLPLRRLPTYPGTATSWQNHTVPVTSAFVVELPGGKIRARKVSRYARAVLAVAAS
ncbi:MAG: M14 family zinc carboxypeptidase [Gaiellaceae bacterium]